MKYLQYILTGLFGLMLAGCSDADSPLPPGGGSGTGAEIVGDKVILTSSLDVEGFREVNVSRAFTDQPTLADLSRYLVEFIDNGDPLTNTLSAVYRPSAEAADAANSKVTYTVTLNKTDQPRILHLLAVADDNLDIPYGVESSVMPGLTATDNQDAYWRRLEFKNGYCKRDADNKWVINDDLNNTLIGKDVKLVRNFAKLTVGSTAGNFVLEGFMIVNTPQQGTMVPYSATNKMFPEFLNADGTPDSYANVAKIYAGISPGGTELGNTIPSAPGPEISSQPTTIVNGIQCLPAQYMYERPFRSINRTFIIVKGRYTGDPKDPNPQPTYYKLDLGSNDNNGIFRYYGILRNFNYNITIKGVETAGYPNPAAAAEGTVYNNISFDVDTDELKNMSDGKDLIRVNSTTVVVTDDNYSFDFEYAYKSDIRTNGKYDHTKATLIDYKPGAVISKIDPTGIRYDAEGADWYTAKIFCNPPTDITETQSFIVVNSSTGLGRTINLVSHKKWEFENPCQYAGIWEDYPATYNGLYRKNTDGSQGTMITGLQNATYDHKCGTNVGSQFTIFFDIPDNIPEVLFPLEFTIESDLQGLENEPMGTIVVAPGPSLFPNNKDENRIQYIKSVTWTEYNSPLRMDVRDDNGTMIGNPEDGPVTHRVRCRFRTIETVSPTTVNVAIDNQNFNMTQISFERTAAANSLTGPGLVIQPQS